jgi:1,2-diacylglycerol 3-beta-glucosyltransferase
VARAAGAQVLERHDLTLRGKGYALAYAFDHSAQEGFADAVVVVDADAEVSANLLEAFATRIENGAKALQAHYGILNPLASWRTELITIAMGAFHILRSRARERLGLSCGVRGNGWCVTHEMLREVPYHFYSLAEDVEFGVALGMVDVRVEYAGEAFANADMAASEKTARSQRERWENGRKNLVRQCVPPLLRDAVRKPSLICLDLALDLLVPPLSSVAVNVVLLGVVAAVLMIWSPVAAFWAKWALGLFAMLVLYVLRGWQVSGLGARGLRALAHVPGFILWRIKLLLTSKASSEWIRTEREKP